MTRLFRKGGTWKNHEDEVLKAAVMKYGKNQWARAASLLPKKTAAQAKERWNSWLDPSIKKTEWTKEEEEKLIHLVRIMPTMWRTIAPIVGRTPHQCIEHYEKLLDQAATKGEDYDPLNDPRKLRPGEIDPNPEQKPPKPDDLDMSDDEKEMLNAARARLANTKGKKAKRKARAKHLDEARRLAAVQKRRELKAAGIDPVSHMKKKHGMDYSTEMPFFKAVPAGFFDTSEELKRKNQDDAHFNNLDIQKAEGTQRAREEFEARREDKKKALKKKQEDLPAHFEMLNKKNDPSSTVKKAPLVMPAPQVTGKELAALRRMGPAAMEAVQAERMEAMTERTPMVADSTPRLTETMGRVEAARMRQATAKDVKLSLDNLSKPKDEVSLALKITDEQRAVLHEREDTEAAKSSASTKLDATDAAEVRKRKKTGILLSKVTQAVQRGLPRPAVASISLEGLEATDPERLIREEMKKLVTYDASVHPMKGKKSKNKLNLDDYTHDELEKAATEIRMEEAKLKKASSLFREAEGDEPGAVDGFVLVDPESVVTEMVLAADDFLFVPNPSRILSKRQCSNNERLASLKHEFDVTKNHTTRMAEASFKLEKKVGMLTAGYVKRSESLYAGLKEKLEELEEAKIQLASYEHMWQLEEVAIAMRTQVAKEKLTAQQQREATLQAQYGSKRYELQQHQERLAAKRKREEAAKADADALAELEEEEDARTPAKKACH